MDVAPWKANWIMVVSDGIRWYCMVFNGILLLNSIHWYSMVFRHGTSGGCNWSFETALPLLPRYWACMIVEMERLMVGDWICVEV